VPGPRTGGFKPTFGPVGTRESCEFVLLGKCGKGRALSASTSSSLRMRRATEVLASLRPPRSHSVKPDSVYERIEKMYRALI